MDQTKKFLAALLNWILVAMGLMCLNGPAAAVRLKDVADVEGVRSNQLIGFGIVVGLNGTGDKRGAGFTPQSVANMLERMGVRVSGEQIQLSNSAAVMVTASLPPFSRPGSRLDVTLSSLGDASSLQGGVLLMTPLKGPDGVVYAVAQGPISVGGFAVESSGDAAQKNHPTVGQVPLGANVEKTIPYDVFGQGGIRVVLRQPDFTTVLRIREALNRELGTYRAQALDGASVVVVLDRRVDRDPISLVSRIENVEIDPDVPARVVVNERTGTVIVGEHVRVSTVAIAHGNLNITIRRENQVSQPNALAGGETAVIQNTDVNVGEEGGRLQLINQTVSLGEVVHALNALGATPRDLIVIFQAMSKAGALNAELVIM